MTPKRTEWENTTHDWARDVDATHLAQVRAQPAVFAPDGLRHLVLEVLAYAADEAASATSTWCSVTLHADGSVSVADGGRGTDIRQDANGVPTKKPVMATKDLRFFDHPGAEILPNDHPRRGMSVVAALSTWLVHTNRRHDGAWTQRYEHGLPVTDLLPVADNQTTGTTVHFLPDVSLLPAGVVSASELERLARRISLRMDVVDETASTSTGRAQTSPEHE